MSESEKSVEAASAEGTPLPPAPPSELPAEEVAKVQAIAEALTELGSEADPARLVEHILARQGLRLDREEVARIKAELLKRAATPPGPDRPPPENAQGRPAVNSNERNPFERSGPMRS